MEIYEASAEEVLALTDAIQVKAQKPTRERKKKGRCAATGEAKRERKKKREKKRIETDLMLVLADVIEHGIWVEVVESPEAKQGFALRLSGRRGLC